MSASFPDGVYADVPGLCAVATLEQIEKQGWSLNPGRYVGVAAAEDDGIDFRVRLEELNEELEKLNAEAAAAAGADRRERRGAAGMNPVRPGVRYDCDRRDCGRSSPDWLGADRRPVSDRGHLHRSTSRQRRSCHARQQSHRTSAPSSSSDHL